MHDKKECWYGGTPSEHFISQAAPSHHQRTPAKIQNPGLKSQAQEE